MNPVTQAIAAAHAIVVRAAASGEGPVSLMTSVSDSAAEFPALDAPLAELTGEELKTLAFAADVLARRALAIETHRHSVARATAIAEIKKSRKQV